MDGHSSEDSIRQVVENILKDKKLNLPFVPDFIERKIYVNVFRFTLEAIKKVLSTVKVYFMGTEIHLKLENPETGIQTPVE